MGITTVNPTTGEDIKDYPFMSDKEVDNVVETAHQAFLTWGEMSFADRGKCMTKAAKILRDDKEKYASLITLEMGKPITQARKEIEKCAVICDHYVKSAETYLAPREIKTEMTKSFVCYQPSGVIFAIMPWNFPFWQVFRFAAPNLMAGNVGILSHAPISTGAAMAMQDIFLKAGFPKGAFTSVVIENPQAAKIIAHPHVVAVTLTGSERAGKAVAGEAANALKKVVFRIGW